MLNIKLTKQRACQINGLLRSAYNDVLCNGTEQEVSETFDTLMTFQASCREAGYDCSSNKTLDKVES